MADKPTPTEPDTSANLSKSFADRLTFPTDSTKTTNGTNPNASSFTPTGKFSWADEVTTPTQESEEKVEDTSTPSKSQAAKTDDGSLDMAQTDGSTTFTGGSGGLEEPEFDVNVKLADLQEDPNNPLYSAKSFSDLQL